MEREAARRCVRALEVRWGKQLSPAEFTARADWFERKPVEEADVINALDRLQDSCEWMPRSKQIYDELLAQGAFGQPIHGEGDPRLVSRHKEAVVVSARQSATNLGEDYYTIIERHRADAIEVARGMVYRNDKADHPDAPEFVYDGDYGFWRDRVEACEQLLGERNAS